MADQRSSTNTKGAERRNAATVYGLSVAAVGVAGVLRWLFDPFLGDHLPFVTFVAVAVAAWLGGLRPALLATVLGFVTTLYFFVPPRHSFALPSGPHLFGLAMYFMVSFAFAGFGEAMRVARRRDAERKERLRTTLASIGDAVITTDTEGRVTNLNPVAETLTGWKNADAVGQPLDVVFNIVNETTRKAVGNPAFRALREGVIVGLANHTILIAKDGTERPIDDSAAPIRCKVGEVVGCVLVFRDISERKKAEAELQRRTATLRAITDTTTDLIFLKDRDCRLVFANPATLTVMGTTEEQAVGVDPHTLFTDPAEGEAIWAIDRRIMASGVAESVEEFFTGPNGTHVYLSTKTPLRDDQGAVVGVIGISRDITTTKRADEIFRRQRQQLDFVLSATGVGTWFNEYPLGDLNWDEPTRALFFVRPGEEPTAELFWSRLHPDDREPTRLAVEGAVRGRTLYDIDHRVVNPDTGEVRWVRSMGRMALRFL